MRIAGDVRIFILLSRAQGMHHRAKPVVVPEPHAYTRTGGGDALNRHGNRDQAEQQPADRFLYHRSKISGARPLAQATIGQPSGATHFDQCGGAKFRVTISRLASPGARSTRKPSRRASPSRGRLVARVYPDMREMPCARDVARLAALAARARHRNAAAGRHAALQPLRSARSRGGQRSGRRAGELRVGARAAAQAPAGGAVQAGRRLDTRLLSARIAKRAGQAPRPRVRLLADRGSREGIARRTARKDRR